MIQVLEFILGLLVVITPIEPPPVVYSRPEVCNQIPDNYWVACVEPDSWDDFCLSVTNYWPFTDDGELVAGNGQTDSDPTKTAAGATVSSVEQDGAWVALPLPLISGGYYSYICFGGHGCLPAWDTFGHQTYQDGGFWHDIYRRRVIGVDIFTAEETHYLVCNDEDNPNRFRLDIYSDGVLTNP